MLHVKHKWSMCVRGLWNNDWSSFHAVSGIHQAAHIFPAALTKRQLERNMKQIRKLADFLKYTERKCCPQATDVSAEPLRFNLIFANLRTRKWCPCGTRLSREGMVISISLEFYILPEEPQKDCAWIFKIALQDEGKYLKRKWMIFSLHARFFTDLRTDITSTNKLE